MTQGEVLQAYVGTFLDRLIAAGACDMVVCPGSRSTPLAMVAASHPGARLWMHLDERAAGYFALGMAKYARRPVALICTSGTAAANFLPAVVEARQARVPLVVITADRPHELRDVGAPQTIDQVHLYGRHVKWFVDASLPEATAESLRYVGMLAERAVATAQLDPHGPVHLNFPFREPLVPAGAPPPRGRTRWAAIEPVTRAPAATLVNSLANAIAERPHRLIVCGPQEDPALPESVVRLARMLDAPILADPLSGVRRGAHHDVLVLDAYDATLRDAHFVEAHPPDVVLRFGAMPTSKLVLQYLQANPDCHQLVVDGGGEWSEPTVLGAEVVHSDGGRLCDALVGVMNDRAIERDPSWRAEWIAADRAAGDAIGECLVETDELFEGRVLAEVASLLPEGGTLFVGSSMPVRDLDTFVRGGVAPLRFMANRGANGIDGVTSSALGAAAAGARPLALVIGDISFFHDLTGLLAARQHQLDATVVLINNDGGGIFSFLPQVEHPEHFERLFGTPHGLDFRPAVEMFGGRYARARTWHELRSHFRAGIEQSGLCVVEVTTERARNVVLHRRVWPRVSEAIARAIRTATEVRG